MKPSDFCCDVCNVPEPAETPRTVVPEGWLAVLLHLEDVPYPVGFVVCKTCKLTSVAHLESVARKKWQEALDGVQVIAKDPEEQGLANMATKMLKWQCKGSA